jgi:myo-inositol 2-dehydrogenase / D-chiro-inositol 1-dehydrogenase
MTEIGVIGCGKIAEKHLMGYRSSKDAQIILCDAQTEQAKKLAGEFNCTWVPEIADILENPKVTAVDICTPTPTHEPLMQQSIRAGKHVFCEKPLTDSLESARRLQDLAQSHNRLLMAGFLYRFHPAFEMVKQVLEEKVIGQPYMATFRLGGRGSHRLWKHRKGQGGGAINEMLVHMLDLALWYFGDLEFDSGQMATVLSQRQVEGQVAHVDAEDFVQVKLRSPAGVQIFCQADLITPSYMNYMEVMGTEGSLIASILDHLPTAVFCQRPRGIYQQGNNFFSFPKTNLFERELTYFLDCLNNGKHPQINSLDDSVKLIGLMEKIKKESAIS